MDSGERESVMERGRGMGRRGGGRGRGGGVRGREGERRDPRGDRDRRRAKPSSSREDGPMKKYEEPPQPVS